MAKAIFSSELILSLISKDSQRFLNAFFNFQDFSHALTVLINISSKVSGNCHKDSEKDIFQEISLDILKIIGS